MVSIEILEFCGLMEVQNELTILINKIKYINFANHT